MTKTGRGTARLAAAAGALMLTGLGFSVPGVAHPHDEATDNAKVERVIILREGAGGKHRGKGDRVRTFQIERGKGDRVRTIRIEGDGDHAVVAGPRGDRQVRVLRLGPGAQLVDCDGEKTEIDESTGNDRTRVVVCGKGDLTAAQRIEKLEKVLGRINANEELSAEHKERVTAALREAIERMRTTP